MVCWLVGCGCWLVGWGFEVLVIPTETDKSIERNRIIGELDVQWIHGFIDQWYRGEGGYRRARCSMDSWIYGFTGIRRGGIGGALDVQWIRGFMDSMIYGREGFIAELGVQWIHGFMDPVVISGGGGL